MRAEQRKTVIWLVAILAIVIFWPIAALVLLIYLGDMLKDLLKDIDELSFKAGSLNLTAKKVPVKTALPSKNVVGEVNAVSTRSQADRTHEQQPLRGFHILWVDDIPSNNVVERRAFEKMGVQFTISTSTEDALEKVRVGKYDAIISDMGRPPDLRAGYTLLQKLQQAQMDLPFVIYSSSNHPEHKAEAIRNGAVGATNHLSELVELVKEAL